MSIEAKPSSNPYENSQEHGETNQITDTTETLTNGQLRKKVPGHKPSILEKLDTPAKQFTAAAVLGSVVLGGAYGFSRIAEGMGNDNEDSETHAQAPLQPGELETTAPQPTVEASPFASPSNITPLETAEPIPAQGADALSTIGIEANQSDEAMAKDFINTLSAWHMAGATPEAKAVRSSQYGSLTLDAYADKIATEQAAIFAPKLFGKDYTSNALLMNTVNGFKEANRLNIKAFLQTSGNSNPANKEAYTRSVIFDEFTALPAAGADKSFSVDFHETDNSDKNIIGTGAGGMSEVNGKKGTATLSLNTVGEEMVITQVKFIDQ